MGLFSLPKHPTFSETYISGLPFCKQKAPINFEVKSEGLNVKIMINFKYKKFLIPKEDILEIVLNQETYRSAGKAAAGAIVGGLLTGGVGLLAGAAIGGKRRKENDLTLVVKYENEVCYINLKQSKTIPKLYQEIKAIMPLQEQHATSTSNADELLKFAELRDKGIISTKEFESKKKQLLNL